MTLLDDRDAERTNIPSATASRRRTWIRATSGPDRDGAIALAPMAHGQMVVAIQPFLSGRVSKLRYLPAQAPKRLRKCSLPPRLGLKGSPSTAEVQASAATQNRSRLTTPHGESVSARIALAADAAGQFGGRSRRETLNSDSGTLVSSLAR